MPCLTPHISSTLAPCKDSTPLSDLIRAMGLQSNHQQMQKRSAFGGCLNPENSQRVRCSPPLSCSMTCRLLLTQRPRTWLALLSQRRVSYAMLLLRMLESLVCGTQQPATPFHDLTVSGSLFCFYFAMPFPPSGERYTANG